MQCRQHCKYLLSLLSVGFGCVVLNTEKGYLRSKPWACFSSLFAIKEQINHKVDEITDTPAEDRV